ncbi:anti-sigma factor [Nocardioides marinquilinus]|uniref:Regulator of SigK n=1 Tax=Nocardioides marinquilinus TaxID=1210400 RepID=A0ABP9P8C0_9ACTN
MNVDIHALSGAYAVDAVDDLERARFERHLADCAECRAEVTSLRAAAGLLAESSATTPPASLREAVLAEVATTRPLPPVVAAAAERGRSTRRRFPALVAAAAALIVVGGVGATVWHPWTDDAPGSDQATEQTYTADVGSATVTVVRSGDQATVSTKGMPAAPAGKKYELWLVHDDRYVHAGEMTGDASQVLLEGDAATANAVGITLEDVDGPPEPDLDNVIGTVDLEQA